MNNLVVTLTEADLVDLQTVLIDRDESAAMRFLEDRVAPKLPPVGSAPCDSNRLNPYLLKRER